MTSQFFLRIQIQLLTNVIFNHILKELQSKTDIELILLTNNIQKHVTHKLRSNPENEGKYFSPFKIMSVVNAHPLYSMILQEQVRRWSPPSFTDEELTLAVMEIRKRSSRRDMTIEASHK